MSVNRIIRSSSFDYGEAYAPVMNGGLSYDDVDSMQRFADKAFELFGTSPIILTRHEKKGLIQFEKKIPLKADYNLDTPIFLAAVYTDSLRIRLSFLELICARRIKNGWQFSEPAENIIEVHRRLSAIIAIRKGLIRYLSRRYEFCMQEDMPVCELTGDSDLQEVISCARGITEPIELSLVS